jgi:hypothetical protein
MGCFSFKCLECGRGVLSSSFSGEKTHLFLLKKGKVVQQMTGEYNSYGAVFIDNSQRKDVKHDLRESVSWKDPSPEDTSNPDRDPWHKVCDLMHNRKDFTGGIAAIHVDCYKGVPPDIRSPQDPNQGWGDEDDDDNYFGTTEGEGHEYPKRKPVKGYDPRKELRMEQLEEEINSIYQDVTFLALTLSHHKLLKLGVKADDNMKKRSEEVDQKRLEEKKKKLDDLKKEYLALGGSAEHLEYYK